MKAKNSEVSIAIGAVNALVLAEGVRAREGFRIMTLGKGLESIGQVYAATRKKAGEGHARKDGKGKPKTKMVKGPDGSDVEVWDIIDQKAYDAEIEALDKEEVDVAVQPLRVSDLRDAILPEGWTMTRLMFALGPFIVDDEEPKKEENGEDRKLSVV